MRADRIGAIIAVAGVDRAAELARRRLRDDRERAAFGVAAEQRTLRTLQHLDALNVEQRGVQAMLTGKIDAVHIDADALFARGLVGVERHDAADPDGQRALAGFEGGDAERWNAAVGKIIKALDVAILDRLLVDDADRNRGALEIGLALGGGDNDLLNGGLFAGGGCGVRRRGGSCSLNGRSGVNLRSEREGEGGDHRPVAPGVA